MKSLFATSTLAFLFVVPSSFAATSYTYDELNRLRTAIYDNGLCVAYTYDANGNRTAQSNTTGSSTTPTWGTGVLGCFVWTP